MRLAGILEAGRQDFMEATSGISTKMSTGRAAPGNWSVLECIEHVVIVETRYLDWIASGPAITPRRDTERELKLFTIVRSRLTKVEAPESIRPYGRFDSIADALAEFSAVRSRSIRVVEELGESLYSIGVKHPRFGNLNGGEAVQLIDAHARRHADQIREIREALTSESGNSMKPVKAKKAAGFHRDAPDLPKEFDSLGDDKLPAEIETTHLADLNAAELRLETFRVEGSILERVQFAGGEFGSVAWKDVRLVGCDLANIRAHRMTLLRVELVDCRLTGFHATALEWQDVLITNGDMRYVQLQSGKFRNCEFDGCNCEEADLHEADLSGCVVRGCNLAHADLCGTNLQNTDLRKSEVEGMVVGMGDLRGAIVEPAQAMILARVLGLQIK
ncbi:MAG TPA: pentapeptide repeat-containing protein [Bryobacteraceae bacterium]|nr:pentapeptide repeat-containing protein [Bryobacteraceae bacterium]